ncbi:hypothetical protein [Mucilaginibacter sp. CSA2-8R]|uniref:hypothetical protein n=1 Tax=Mucilaginibacter sp. CSA2-8R TaxID=3141542 RepID=UPI00315DD520
MNIRQQPYHLLAFTGLTAVLLSLLPIRQLLSINLHDTYIVIPYVPFLRCWAVLLLVLWGVNVVGSGVLKSARLKWVHTVSVLLAFLSCHSLLLNPEPVFHYNVSRWASLGRYLMMVLPFVVIIAALFVGLIALLANFITSFRPVTGNS